MKFLRHFVHVAYHIFLHKMSQDFGVFAREELRSEDVWQVDELHCLLQRKGIEQRVEHFVAATSRVVTVDEVVATGVVDEGHLSEACCHRLLAWVNYNSANVTALELNRRPVTSFCYTQCLLQRFERFFLKIMHEERMHQEIPRPPFQVLDRFKSDGVFEF